jgi:Holliday junction DNA helicase RuvB
MGVSLQLAVGAGLKAPKDLVPYLTNLTENSVLFIDEIHRVPRSVEEYLYTSMEDFRIDIVLGEGVNARTLNMPLKRFTLIGATTRAGMLSGPLRDRFQIREHLSFYAEEELYEIVTRNAMKLTVPIDESAAREVAHRSRGTPRIANNLLRWIRDYAESKADGRITLEVALAALKMIEIDELGLGVQERRYLQTLIRVFGGGPAGIEAIAHTMNVAVDTLSDDVEPFLLRSELVIRSPRGRMVTGKTYAHLELPPPDENGHEDDDPQQQQLFG